MNTREAIQREFIQLYERKNYNEISIKELCDKTPVARTTFYSYYQNLDDLKEEIESSMLEGLTKLGENLKDQELSAIEIHKFMQLTMDYINEHLEVMKAFLIFQPNDRFIKAWKEDIKNHVKKHYQLTDSNPNEQLFLEVVASSAMESYCYCIQHPNDVNRDRLYESMKSTISSMIHGL